MGILPPVDGDTRLGEKVVGGSNTLHGNHPGKQSQSGVKRHRPNSKTSHIFYMNLQEDFFQTYEHLCAFKCYMYKTNSQMCEEPTPNIQQGLAGCVQTCRTN